MSSQLTLTTTLKGLHISVSIFWMRKLRVCPRSFCQEVAELELKPISLFISYRFAILSHCCEEILINHGRLYYSP